MNDILYCVKYNLLIMINRGNEINLSKLYKQTFMVLLNLLKNLNKIKPILKDIIGDLMSFSDVYKCYIFTNFYHLRDIINRQNNIINELNETDNDSDKDKIGKQLISERKMELLTQYYNNIINKNSSFFVGIMEILLLKEFYSNYENEQEKYKLMISAFDRVSSIMSIKDCECLSSLCYANLFNLTLSFTSLLEKVMNEYLPDIIVLNDKKSEILYFNYSRKNNTTGKGDFDNNVLISYFKLLNLFFRNKAINKSVSKLYFQKFFRFVLGNHRYDLSIVYHFLYMFYYFIEQDYKYDINYEEIMQLIDYLNELTNLKEEDILNHNKQNNKEEIDNDNNNINNKNKNEIINEKQEEEEICNINNIIDNKDNKENDNKNNNNLKIIKEKIKSIIICILIEILFSQNEKPEPLNELFNYINRETLSDNLFMLIKDEIDKYFQKVFKGDEDSLLIKKNNKDFPKYYSNLFNLLFSILNCLLSDRIEYNISEDNNNVNVKETQKILCILSVINILSSITNTLDENIKQRNAKKETIYFIINFIKFFYKIIKDEQLNILYEHNLFFTISQSIINFSVRLSLIHSNFMINLDEGAEKTIIEIILDIYMEYSIKICLKISTKNIFQNYHSIQFFSAKNIQDLFIIDNKNKKLKEKNVFNYNEKVTLFFINDYLKLISTNKKYIRNDFFCFNLEKKIYDLAEINIFLKNEKQFELIYVVFFLIKLEVFKQEISKKIKEVEKFVGVNQIEIIKQLYGALILLQKIAIDDYKKLFILNKDLCTKSTSEYPCYQYASNIVELKIMVGTKKMLTDDIFSTIINGINICLNSLTPKEKYRIKSGIAAFNRKENKFKKYKTQCLSVIDISLDNDLYNKDSRKTEGPMNPKYKMNNNELLNDDEDDYKKNKEKNNIRERKYSFDDNSINKESDNIFNFENNDSIDVNKVIPLPDIDNIFLFFEQYDEMYLRNAKKELMNNIFAFCFKKSFFYNNTFEILKKYYLNNYEAEEYTKKLKFPSKIKHFNNGLEPPLFLKNNSNFYISKVFPITHVYFYNYMKKNKIINDSIILFKKKYNIIKNNKNKKQDFDVNCELILIDHSFYGHLINFNDNKYLIFQEKKFELFEKEPKNDKKFFSDLFSMCTVVKRNNRVKKEIINENQRNKREKKVKRDVSKEIIIFYSEIEQIIERRFLLMWQGIEIYLKNGKSYFFNLIR